MTLAALILAGADFARAAPGPGSPVAFCRERVVRDYEAPLADLPPVAGLTATGQLPFGPAGLTIHPAWLGLQRVAAGPAAIGFGFGYPHPGPPLTLNWDVRETIWTLGPGGEKLGVAAQVQQRVGTVSPFVVYVRSSHPLPVGIYLVEVDVSDDSGQAVGSFAEYVRVVPRRTQARLILSRKHVRPGQSIYARLENLGTEEIGFGLEFAIQRYEKGKWRLVRLPLWAQKVLKLRLIAPAGRSRGCSRFPIAANLSPGRYRFVKEVDQAWTGKAMTLTAAFRVGG